MNCKKKKNKPIEIPDLFDPRGVKLEEGQTVVFNQSGALRVGRIEKFIPRKRQFYANSSTPQAINIHVSYGGKKNAVVRFPSNLMVINEVKGDCKDALEGIATEIIAGSALIAKDERAAGWNDANNRAARIVRSYKDGRGLFQQ